MPRPGPSAPAPRPGRELAVLGALLALSFAARLPFRGVPLIRDEGELALIGQRMLAGELPYADLYFQKTPLGPAWMAGVLATLGQGLAAIRLATAAWGLLATLLVHRAARAAWGPRAALFAAGAFAVATFDQCGQVHPTSTEFLSLPWIALAVLWSVPREGGRPVLRALGAGVAAGLAVQTKQTALALVAWLVLERLLRAALEPGRAPDRWRGAVRDVGLRLAGAAAVTAAALALFAIAGALPEYVACTWTNNWAYVGERPAGFAARLDLLVRALRDVARWDLGLWIAGAAGALLALRGRGKPGGRGERGDGGSLLLLLLALCGAALGAGQSYAHYWQPLIVPVALGAGLLLARLADVALDESRGPPLRVVAVLAGLAPWIAPGLHALSLAAQSSEERAQLLAAQPTFIGARDFAAWLAERTDPDECIAIVGSEPQVWFHARRRPCSRLIFTYPLLGPYAHAPALREEFLDALREHRPRTVVLVRVQGSISEFTGVAEPFLERVYQVLGRGYVEAARLPVGAEPPTWIVLRRRDA